MNFSHEGKTFYENFYKKNFHNYSFEFSKTRITIGQELSKNNNQVSQDTLDLIYDLIKEKTPDLEYPVVSVILTGWARTATNNQDVLDLVQKIKDLKINFVEIISQETEAQYAYRTACLSLRQKELVSADSGGKSTQLSFGDLVLSLPGISSTDIGNLATDPGATSPNPICPKINLVIWHVVEQVTNSPGFQEFKEKIKNIKDLKVVGFGLFSYLRDYLNILGFETRVLTPKLVLDGALALMNKNDQEIMEILKLEKQADSKNRATNFCMIYAIMIALDIEQIEINDIPSSFGPLCC